MKRYGPGASIKSDYYFICDCCEIDDGRPTLIWESVPKRRGHFALCYQCLKRLNQEYNISLDASDPLVMVSRLVISETLRNKIFERDSYKCRRCGGEANLQIDHIIPFSKGGRTEEGNLQTLCKSCNVSKRDTEA